MLPCVYGFVVVDNKLLSLKKKLFKLWSVLVFFHSSSSLDTGGNLINRNILSQQKPYNYHQVQQQQQHHHQQHQQQPTPFSVSSVKRDSMVAGIVNLGYDHCST